MIRNGVAASPQYGLGAQTDVFSIGANGQLNVSWVVQAGTWNGPVGLGPAGVFPAGAAVAASNQYGVPNQTDAFAIGDNGQLQVFWVESGGTWSGPVGLGPAGVYPPGAALAASPQYGVDAQTDVFAIGDNGQLHVSWVLHGGAWSGPVGLGPAGLFPPGAALTASNQYGVPAQTDVFAISNNGQLQVFWVERGGTWSGPVGLGPAGVFPAGAAVAASPQYGVPNQTDVFAIGNNGQLQVFWVESGGNWNGPVGLGPAGLFPPGAALTASNQYGVPTQTDVFAISNNGQLQVFWVERGGTWSGPVGLGPAGVCSPGTAVAASPQYGLPDQTDVFAIGNNGQLHVFWVVGGGTWNGPISLAPPPHIALRAIQNDDGRFIEVDGGAFTPNGAVSLAYDFSTGGAPDTHETGEAGAKADGGGALTTTIKVNLPEIGEAGVKATDVATNRSATGSL
jgi:hypothetical protein